MIIGIDASSLTLTQPTGVQQYTKALLTEILKTTKHQLRLYSPHILDAPFSSHQRVIYFPRWWTQLRLPLELYWRKPDLFWQPGYMLPPFCPCPSVVTIHDLGWIYYPHAYSDFELRLHQTALKRIINLGSRVIVPSLSTQKDCIHRLHIHHDHIEVVPEGLVRLPSVNLKDFPDIARYAAKPIVLSVGRLEERKNTKTLVRAIGQLAQYKKNDPPTLVLIGSPGYGAVKVFEAISAAKSEGAEILHLGYINDRELSAWFKVANLFVYPSLYEGFGLPILQSFAAKVPLITTAASSMPEVAGEAALYLHDPHSEPELAAAINAVLFDHTKASRLIALGTKQLKQFSWTKAADQTIKVLEKVAGEANRG